MDRYGKADTADEALAATVTDEGRYPADVTARLARACVVALLALMGAGCTFVNIEGDHNSISDTGGHGGGVSLPAAQRDGGPVERLWPPPGR